MPSNDTTPYEPQTGRSHGSWFVVVILLAIVGAIVLLPAVAHIVFGLIGAIFAVIAGLIGAAIGVAAALLASVFALGAVAIGLIALALPILLLIGIGILIGRGARES